MRSYKRPLSSPSDYVETTVTSADPAEQAPDQDLSAHLARVLTVAGVLGVARTNADRGELLHGAVSVNALEALCRLGLSMDEADLTDEWTIIEFEAGFLLGRTAAPWCHWVVADGSANPSMVRVALDVTLLKIAAPARKARPRPTASNARGTDLVEAFTAASGPTGVARRMVERFLAAQTGAGASSEQPWQELRNQLSRLLRGEARNQFDLRCELADVRREAGRTRAELTRHEAILRGMVEAVGASVEILGAPADEDGGRVEAMVKTLDTAVRELRDEDSLDVRARISDLASICVAAYGEASACRDLQRSLLPADSTATASGLTIAATCQSASCVSSVGGDWWFHGQPDGIHSIIVVADVAGHGIAAALGAGVARVAFEAALDDVDLDPARILTTMSALVRKATRGTLFMTCQVALIDRDGRVRLASAGHPFAYLLRRPAGVAPSLNHIVVNGPLIGAADAAFEVRTVQLGRNDRLVLYTDGLTESSNSLGVPYGDKRLRRRLLATAEIDLHRTVDLVMGDLAAHLADRTPSDDITLVMTEYSS